MNNQVPRLAGIAGLLADRGRHGDTMLMHVTPNEVEAMASLGPVTINPDTGLPEAFGLDDIWKGIKTIAPIAIGAWNPLLGAGIAGLIKGISDDSLKSGLLAGATTYLGGKALNAGRAAASGASEAARAGVDRTISQGATDISRSMNAARAAGGDSLAAASSAAEGLSGRVGDAVQELDDISLLDKFRIGGKASLDFLSDPALTSFVYPQLGNLANSIQNERRGNGAEGYLRLRNRAQEEYDRRFGGRRIGGFAGGGVIDKDGDGIPDPPGGGGGTSGPNPDDKSDVDDKDGNAGDDGGGSSKHGSNNTPYWYGQLPVGAPDVYSVGHTIPAGYQAGFMPEAQYFANTSGIANANQHLRSFMEDGQMAGYSPFDTSYTDAVLANSGPTSGPTNLVNSNGQNSTQNLALPETTAKAQANAAREAQARLAAREKFPYVAPGGQPDFDPGQHTPGAPQIPNPFNPNPGNYNPPGSENPYGVPFIPGSPGNAPPAVGFGGGWTSGVFDYEDWTPPVNGGGQQPPPSSGNPPPVVTPPADDDGQGGGQDNDTGGTKAIQPVVFTPDRTISARNRFAASLQIGGIADRLDDYLSDGSYEFNADSAKPLRDLEYAINRGVNGPQFKLEPDYDGSLFAVVPGEQGTRQKVESVDDILSLASQFGYNAAKTADDVDMGFLAEVMRAQRAAFAGRENLFNPEAVARDAIARSVANSVVGGAYEHLFPGRYDPDAVSDSMIQRLIEMSGFSGGGMIEGYADGGLLNGPGGGMDDGIMALVEDTGEPVRVASGEFVVPADVVSMLGDGDTSYGAMRLKQMMNRVRKEKTGSGEQAPPIDPNRVMPG